MPDIKIQHVVSCSSADKNNPAENLLKQEGSHKWKTTGQPKNAVVVLQLEKASQIQSIDVGNEGSAFVEILVGRETATTDQDYKVILVASSFMTPLESRNGTNRNTVRMFGPEKLSNAVSSEKWDRVKIVCTQPFNKSSEYGLSFIKFHSTPTAEDKKKEEGIKKLGAFTVKPETGDDIASGSLFAKKKTEPAEKPAPTGAAAVRAASRLADESILSPKVEKHVKIMPNPVSTSQNKRKHSEDSDEEEKPSSSGTPKFALKKQSTSLSSTASSVKSESAPPRIKKTKSEPPKESPMRSFGRLMEGVTFAMSGFQNPYRAELRQKAVDMGAIYKADWGKGCTHLICAFSNTPKYNQVKGKGKIVKKDWILQCYKQKKLLPWKNFRLGDADTPDESSTEDEDEYIPKKKLVKKQDSPPPKPKPNKEVKYMSDSDSGDDTEEEIRKVKAKIEKGKVTTPKKKDDDDIYDASTDEDKPSSSKKTPPKKETDVKNGDDDSDSGFPELPDFFRKKHFLLYGELNEKTKRSMIRYITAYDGELEDYMSDKVNFVVTNSEWDQNFDDALADNSSLIFVKPIWIAKCHDKSKFVPFQPYVVVPSESD